MAAVGRGYNELERRHVIKILLRGVGTEKEKTRSRPDGPSRQVWSLLHPDEDFDTTVFIDEANLQLHRKTHVVWCPVNEAPPRIDLLPNYCLGS